MIEKRIRSLKIGSKFKNKKGNEFEIIGYIEDNINRRIIRFINTGFTVDAGCQEIREGSVEDYLEPSLCGVGFSGYRGASKHPLHNRWSIMINRCYNDKFDSYKFYGAKGVYVDKSWHDFRNFVRDMEKKENYDKLINEPTKWQIDKDLSGKNYYSNETTQIISRSENVKEVVRRTRRAKKINMYDLDGNFIKTHESITSCANELGVNHTNISDCLLGRQKTSCGYTFRYTKENNIK